MRQVIYDFGKHSGKRGQLCNVWALKSDLGKEKTRVKLFPGNLSHVDWIERQQEARDQVGLENYLGHQTNKQD